MILFAPERESRALQTGPRTFRLGILSHVGMARDLDLIVRERVHLMCYVVYRVCIADDTVGSGM